MYRDLKTMVTKLIAFVFLISASCSTSSEIDIESVNYYTIDNQSDFELFYNTGSGLDERTINIAPSSKVLIEEGRFYASKDPIDANDFFREDPGQEKFLLRRENGNEIKAFQIGNSPDLNWMVESLGNYTYNHTLIVSDQMIN